MGDRRRGYRVGTGSRATLRNSAVYVGIWGSPALLHSFRFFVTPWFMPGAAARCLSVRACAPACNDESKAAADPSRLRTESRSGEIALLAQFQNQRCISAIVLLPSLFTGTNGAASPIHTSCPAVVAISTHIVRTTRNCALPLNMRA